MFPHERSLVKQYANQPFVLLGVNEDPERDDPRKAERDGQVTWRSWWDVGTNGRIASALGVRTMPALFLLDHTGRIRDRWDGVPGKMELEKRIDDLLKEAVQDNSQKH